MEVARGVHRLTNGVSNFYIVEDRAKLLLVDAGGSADWDLFAKAVAALKHTPAELEAVLLTHAHSDHTGFAEQARLDTDAVVWIHTDDAAVAKGAPPGKNERGFGGYLLRAELWRTVFRLRRSGGMKIVPIREVSTFRDEQVIDAPGRPRAVHVPGHTPGMAALLLEGRRLLLTGDSLVMKNPLTGRRGPQIMPRALNRDSREALQSLAKLEDLPADVILPGHGEPWTQGVARAVQLARDAGPS